MAYLKIDALLDSYSNAILVLDLKFIDLLSFL